MAFDSIDPYAHTCVYDRNWLTHLLRLRSPLIDCLQLGGREAHGLGCTLSLQAGS